MRSALSSLGSPRVHIQKLEPRICLASTISPISFSPPINSPVGSAAVIATGEFTGDGNVDLLARSANDGSVKLFKGAGNGTFGTTGIPVSAGFNVTSMVVADFNHDGNLDVAAANNSGMLTVVSQVTILLGKGDGTFTNAGTAFPGANPNALAVGDFNEDGIPDLVSANDLQWSPPGTAQPATYGAGLLLGNGDGTFKPVRKIFLSAPQTHVAVGDFNGDSAPDIALAGPNVMSASPVPQSLVFAAFNTRTGGGFGVLTAAGFPGRAGGLQARDLNNDHHADLEAVQVFARSNTSGTIYPYPVPGDTTVRMYLYQGSTTNSGSDTFKVGPAIQVPMTNPAGLSAADFDKDGNVDLAVAGKDARPTPTANAPGGIVAVIPGRPLVAVNGFPIFRSGPAPLSQAIADLNGDGKPDILTGHASGVSALLNTSRPPASNPVSEGGDLTDNGGGDLTPSPDAIDASV
jgi:hypothetical protein